MFENIDEVTTERKAETIIDSPVKVIKEVVGLMRANPSKVLKYDLTDYPEPRTHYRTEAVLDDRTMTLDIEEDLEKDNIEISLFDSLLQSGAPRDESFSYRVNIISGKTAENYRQSTGHVLEVLSGNLGTDNGKSVISDAWTETNLTPTEALGLLRHIKSFNLPKYRADDVTKTGTPRHIPMAVE